MALLLEYEFRTLPADKQIDTEPFLEAMTHLPPFFGEWRAPRPRRRPGRAGLRAPEQRRGGTPAKFPLDTTALQGRPALLGAR